MYLKQNFSSQSTNMKTKHDQAKILREKHNNKYSRTKKANPYPKLKNLKKYAAKRSDFGIPNIHLYYESF